MTRLNISAVNAVSPLMGSKVEKSPIGQNLDLSNMMVKASDEALQMWDPRKRLKQSLNVRDNEGEDHSPGSSPVPLSEPPKSPLSAPLSVESPLPVITGDFLNLGMVTNPQQIHPACLDSPASDEVKDKTNFAAFHPAALKGNTPENESVDDLLASLGNNFAIPADKNSVSLNDSGVGDELDETQLESLLNSDLPTATPLDTSDPSDILGSSPDSLASMTFQDLSPRPVSEQTAVVKDQDEVEALERSQLAETANDQQQRLEARFEALQAKLRKQRLQILVWQTMRQWGKDKGEPAPQLATENASILHSASATREVLRNGEKALKRKRFLKPVHEIKKRVTILQSKMDEDATDNESDTEMQYTPSNLERQVQSRWEKSKAAAGWRWQWLQLRLEQVTRDLERCNGTLASLRAGKAPLQASVEGAEGSCARDRGFVINSKRKLLKPMKAGRPSNTSKMASSASTLPATHLSMIRRRASVYDGSFHPILSFEQDAPPWLLERATLLRRTTKGSSSITSVKLSVPQSSRRKKKRSMSHPQPDSHHHKGVSSPAVSKLRQSTSIPSSPGTPNKRSRVAKALDIDNVVIPSTLAAKRVVALEVKEIPTPTWSESAAAVDDTKPADAAEHDFSDEAYANLHKAGEERERKRFQGFVGSCNGRKRSASDSATRNDTKQPKVMDSEKVRKAPQVAPYPPRKFPLSKKVFDRILAEQQAVEISARTSGYSIVQPVEDPSTDGNVTKPLKLVLKIKRNVD